MLFGNSNKPGRGISKEEAERISNPSFPMIHVSGLVSGRTSESGTQEGCCVWEKTVIGMTQ